ncbi:hypothetical protein CAOG_001008 [Capsaspora owczarzaki ATCC 30864]|uniref:LRRNT domain-containing protein n=1 Tax=Capsaspora owczarzaki (strain ATCC 30864) TaxID=595528 RepID=A0A0D2WJL6_CAPO3|nr:hypothetical protein CAOG_001008 [Capsaspora owczarzaki ATCC 30864]
MTRWPLVALVLCAAFMLPYVAHADDRPNGCDVCSCGGSKPYRYVNSCWTNLTAVPIFPDDIQTITFYSMSVTSIPDFAFNLPNLTRLDWTSGVTIITNNTFAGLPSLTALLLGNNRQITSISVGAFQAVPLLTVLELYNNDAVTNYVPALFSGLTKLTNLNVGNTKMLLSTLPLDQLPELVSLDIGRNPGIVSIPDFAFASNPQLSSLILGSTSITSISANAFTGTQIGNLWLNSCAITSIAANAFSGLMLYISSNPLLTLPPGLFAGQTRPQFYANLGSFPSVPPSTYGSASNPTPCNASCATCYGAGANACCGLNCLSCSSTNPCLACYDGYAKFDGFCAPTAEMNASISIQAAIASGASGASVASTASASMASAASIASAFAATAASAASVSGASVASTVSASVASEASASASAAASLAMMAAANASSDHSTPIAGAVGGGIALLALVAAAVYIARRRTPQPPPLPRRNPEIFGNFAAEESKKPASSTSSPISEHHEYQAFANPVYEQIETIPASELPQHTSAVNMNDATFAVTYTDAVVHASSLSPVGTASTATTYASITTTVNPDGVADGR